MRLPTSRPFVLAWLAAFFLGCVAAPAAAPAAAPVVVVPVPVQTATPEPADEGPDDEPAPAAAASGQSLTGVWEEEFESRSGCSDAATIREQRGQIRIAGADCNDGEAYEFADIERQRGGLKFRLIVPKSGWEMIYRLERVAPDLLEGTSEPHGREGQTYQVRWRRREKP